MSRAIVICPRLPRDMTRLRSLLTALATRLTPAGAPADLAFAGEDGILTAVFGRADCAERHGASVCLGVMMPPTADWWRVGAPIPDGSFGLVRHSPSTVEVASDALASRTLWYLHHPDLFAVSTSQRALVALAGDFQPNPRVQAWMLANGHIGPQQSWDRRVHCVPPDSVIALDRESWTVRGSTAPVRFETVAMSEKDRLRQLAEALNEAVEHLRLDFSRWPLALSGGLDSRALLLLLREVPGLQAVSWGRTVLAGVPSGDVAVASGLAGRFGIPWRFFPCDSEGVHPEVVLDRFLVAGEGRSDNLAAYTDGFAMWRAMAESGYSGIIRGDEAFGCRRVWSTRQMFSNLNMLRPSDYTCLAPHASELGDDGDLLPESLHRRDREPLAQWRDRLNAEAELPVQVAALTDLKTPWMEVANPLLSRRLVQLARQWPARLRTEKALATTWLEGTLPGVPYSVSTSIGTALDYLRRPEVTRILKDEVDAARGWLPAALLDETLAALDTQPSPRAHRPATMVPPKLRRWVRRLGGLPANAPHLAPHTLAFRILLISRMHRLLAEDARAVNAANLT